MKKSSLKLIFISVAAVLGITASPLSAEDIDIYTGTTATAALPNILIIVDNSANWSAASQHWPAPEKQGQAELRALYTLANELTGVRLGLMLFTAGTGSNPSGGYVRYRMDSMDVAINKNAFIELIGNSGCIDSPNSLNGTPNCIYKNFNNSAEKVGTSHSDYSAVMFEAFKYFGGYTSPNHAHDDVAGAPTDATHFGPYRYAGDPDAKCDIAAYTGGITLPQYVVASRSTSPCGKNYVVFIGNGFPTQDSPSSLLSGINGDTTQLALPNFTTTTTSNCTNLQQTACVNNCNSVPPAVEASFPGYDTYQCVFDTHAGCIAGRDKYQYQGCNTVISVTPTGTYSAPSNNDARYADEWAKYLYTTDVNSALGQQNVTTYTIDVFKDAQDSRQTALLMNMAKHGGGKYYQATSYDQILSALRNILAEIQSVNSVFAAVSLPVNATNRSQNENQVYIGMFRPDGTAKPRWYGNLKRYQIALFGQEAKLADKDGMDAISTTTGFINACSSSFFTTDSGTYWNFSAESAGICSNIVNSTFSDLPDGPTVEKGSVAEVIRKGNDPTGAITWALNRTVRTCASTATDCSGGLVAFNTTNVSAAALGVAAGSHATYVDWILGNNNNAADTESIATGSVRPSIHGDVTHSRPLPINYGGATGVVTYYGSNDGFFRAVSGVTGKELWAFVAPEHHSKLARLRDQVPLISYPNVSPLLIPTPQPKGYFFDGSTGAYQSANSAQVWIYPTMRRGGRMIYALDVTNPTVPAFKWKVGCDHTGTCTTGFNEIGQTWSIPQVAFVGGYGGGTSPLIIVGGGYDTCEDANTSTPACGTALGRKVYIIDADTGSKIKEFNTDRSVAADITLVNRSPQGYADHAYVADTGGSLYRIDFVDPGTTNVRTPDAWTMSKLAYTNGSGRKFLYGPGALVSSDKVYLALGSGDREHPLISHYPYVSDIQNRFYMFIDTLQSSPTAVDLDSASLADFSSSNTCAEALTGAQKGWYIDLDGGQGEQTVTSALITGGLVYFSTNRALTPDPHSCTADLGEARGYAVNLFNASGAVNTTGLCGGDRSNTFIGGGLPPSPVQGTVPLSNGRLVTVMIGGIQRDGSASSPIGSQRVKPVVTQRRSRLYWYNNLDK